MIQVQVKVDPDEPIEKALSRFKKNCTKAGIVKELKKRSYYEKPSEKKRRITLKRERKLKLASRDDQNNDNRSVYFGVIGHQPTDFIYTLKL